MPDANLLIAGSDSMHAKGYLQRLQEKYCNQLSNVKFTGYVEEGNLPNLFWGSNLVVVTNSTSSGSSGVIELAHVYGRAILVPRQTWSDETHASQSGVVLYDLLDPSELAMKLINLLSDPVLQNKIGKQGHQYTLLRRNSFSHAHFRAFKNFAPTHNNTKDLVTYIYKR